VKLYEVSVVTFPAYEETSVAARKKDYEQLQKRATDEWRARMKARLNHGS
jgi:phage head maturation protease